MQRELEVLSDQHTKTCLENSQLSQQLQTERESVMQYQQENQELKHKQVETFSFHLECVDSILVLQKCFISISCQERARRSDSATRKPSTV